MEQSLYREKSPCSFQSSFFPSTEFALLGGTQLKRASWQGMTAQQQLGLLSTCYPNEITYFQQPKPLPREEGGTGLSKCSRETASSAAEFSACSSLLASVKHQEGTSRNISPSKSLAAAFCPPTLHGNEWDWIRLIFFFPSLTATHAGLGRRWPGASLGSARAFVAELLFCTS